MNPLTTDRIGKKELVNFCSKIETLELSPDLTTSSLSRQNNSSNNLSCQRKSSASLPLSSALSLRVKNIRSTAHNSFFLVLCKCAYSLEVNSFLLVYAHQAQHTWMLVTEHPQNPGSGLLFLDGHWVIGANRNQCKRSFTSLPRSSIYGAVFKGGRV